MRFLEQHSSDLDQHWPLPHRSALSALLPRKKGEHPSSMGVCYRIDWGAGDKVVQRVCSSLRGDRATCSGCKVVIDPRVVIMGAAGKIVVSVICHGLPL